MAKRLAVDVDPLTMAQDRLVRAYSSSAGPQEAIDPALAQLLLELGLRVLGQCLARSSPGQMTGAAVRDAAANPSLLTRLAVRRQVALGLGDRWHFIRRGQRQDGPRMVEAILTAAAQAKPEEIEAIYPNAREALEDL